jgi:hypothetical protein
VMLTSHHIGIVLRLRHFLSIQRIGAPIHLMEVHSQEVFQRIQVFLASTRWRADGNRG